MSSDFNSYHARGDFSCLLSLTLIMLEVTLVVF